MKNLNASFTDLNGKTINIETLDMLNVLIENATEAIELNKDYEPILSEEIMNKIRAYWQHRLATLLTIKVKNSKTLYQHWQAGNIGNFGSFQTYIFNAYQRADSINTAKLNTAFPEWFVNPYQL